MPVRFVIVLLISLFLGQAGMVYAKDTPKILIDLGSHQTLYASMNDRAVNPNGLVKLMSIYTALRIIEKENLSLTESVQVKKIPSFNKNKPLLHLNKNDKISLIALLQAVLIGSKDDALYMLVHSVSKNEDDFIKKMNEYAYEIGMNSSHFISYNASKSEDQITTVKDLAILTEHLLSDFPLMQILANTQKVFFQGTPYRNTNTLLWKNDIVHGLFFDEYNKEFSGIILSENIHANGSSRRLLVVSLDQPNEPALTSDIQSLLNIGHAQFETIRLFKKNDTVTRLRVWTGTKDYLPVKVRDDVWITIPQDSFFEKNEKNLQLKAIYQAPLLAPISQGAPIGTLTVMYNDQVLTEIPLIAAETIKNGNFFSKLIDKVKLALQRS